MQRENIIIKLKTREQCKAEQLPEWFIPVSMLGKEHQAYRVYNLNDDYYSYYIQLFILNSSANLQRINGGCW